MLVLENPTLRGQSRITNSLFAGVQLIMPGEVADAHKHVSSAIRFVLDGEGAYTAVEGEKANMSRGDFILTPNWAPHDHGNPGKNPVLWLDVLDMPTINHFETSFMEHYDEKAQNTNRQDGNSLERFGSGVLPDGQTIDTFKHRSPVINYTYARTRPICERLMKTGDIDPSHGARVRYSNPVTGGHVMSTMGAWLAMFPKGFKGKDYQSTDGMIFVCVEGHGSTKVDDKVLEWGPNDVFVIPPWKRYAHNCPEQTVLFSISDRPAQEALGIWREKKLDLTTARNENAPRIAVRRTASLRSSMAGRLAMRFLEPPPCGAGARRPAARSTTPMPTKLMAWPVMPNGSGGSTISRAATPYIARHGIDSGASA